MIKKYCITFIFLLMAIKTSGQCTVQINAQSAVTFCAGDSVILVAATTGGSLVLDQQQNNYNGGTSARNLPGYSEWQSFTAGITGTMTQLDIGFFTYINGIGTLNIFQGTGTVGTLLQTQTVNVFCNGGNCLISFGVNVPVIAGQVYTFQFIPGPGIPDPYGIQVEVPGTYAGGVNAIVDPSGTYLTGFDMVFKTWVGSSLFMQWSNGSTDDTIIAYNSGNYVISVTDSAGCTAFDSINVIVNASPVINLGSDTSLCNGDTLLLNAGTGLNDYEWQNGSTLSTFEVTTSGTYWVAVSDSNGCEATDSILIASSNCSPVVSFYASDTTFCEKNCIDFFDMSINNATSWQWFFNGASPDTSTQQNPTGICYNNYGSFDVTLIACNANGCDTLLLSDFISAIQNPVNIIYGQSDTIWSLPFVNYQWYETTSGIIPGATLQYFIPVQQGSYFCIATDSNGCVATSNTFLITNLSANNKSELGIRIVPNPNDGNFRVESDLSFGDTDFEFKLTDLSGKIVYKSFVKGEAVSVQLKLSEGFYIAEINRDGKCFRQKIIIK